MSLRWPTHIPWVYKESALSWDETSASLIFALARTFAPLWLDLLRDPSEADTLTLLGPR